MASVTFGQPVVATWSLVSGPGDVSFGNPNSPDTSVAFTLPGTYFLRLAANDGSDEAWEEVVITVNPAYVVTNRGICL
jgi:hypothetical protein